MINHDQSFNTNRSSTASIPGYPHILLYTSVMIYHRGANLSEQNTDLLGTNQDLSHTSRYVDESSPEIVRYRIRMPTAIGQVHVLSV